MQDFRLYKYISVPVRRLLLKWFNQTDSNSLTGPTRYNSPTDKKNHLSRKSNPTHQNNLTNLKKEVGATS